MVLVRRVSIQELVLLHARLVLREPSKQILALLYALPAHLASTAARQDRPRRALTALPGLFKKMTVRRDASNAQLALLTLKRV